MLWRSPGGSLLHQLSVSKYLLTGSILLSVLPLSLCCKEIELEESRTVVEEREEEMVTLTIESKKINSRIQLRSADYFLFSTEGTRELLRYSATSGTVEVCAGEYDLVVIANSQGKIDTSVVNRYDVLEQLCCRLESEDPSCPMCSGELHLDIRKNTAVVMEPIPMISRIQLMKVENNMGGLALVENPFVFLTNISSQAEILRHNGFRPSEFIKAGEIEYLDDIGRYPAYPDIELFCYPNELGGVFSGVKAAPDMKLTEISQATGIVMVCTIEGDTVKMEAALPQIGRNAVIYASLQINSADDYKWSFNAGNAPG